MKRMICTFFIIVLIVLSGCRAEWEKIENWQEGYDLGIRYLSEGNYEEAVLAFSAAIEIEPMQADAFVSRAEVYMLLANGDTQEDMPDYLQLAADDLEQALALDVSDVVPYRMLAELYLDMDATDKAINVYAEAIDAGFAEDQDRQAFYELIKDAYKTSGNAEHLDLARQYWDTEALQAFGDYLGIDETIAFAVEDLNWDGIPEMIAGPIFKHGPEDVVATTFYSVYAYRNGVAEAVIKDIFMVPADGWTGPIQITPTRTLISNSHNRVIGAGWHHITWDGENAADIYAGFWASNSSNTEYSYSIDEKDVTAEEFAEFRTTQEIGAVDLIMYPNTHENRMKYLNVDKSEEVKKAEEMLRAITPIVEVLHECGQATHCAQWDYSSAYSRTFVDGNLSGRLYRGEIELMEGEEYDPIGISYYPITNFQTMDALKQHLAGYISEDLFGSDVVDFDGLEEIDGKLYAYRGGRGYGAYGYDTASLKLLSFDETNCVAQCQKMLFDTKDALMQLTFEKQNGRWILTKIEKAS